MPPDPEARLLSLLDELVAAAGQVSREMESYVSALAPDPNDEALPEPWQRGAVLLAESTRKLRCDLEEAKRELLRVAGDPSVRALASLLRQEPLDPRD